MKVNIFLKLFFAVFLSVLLTVAAMMASVEWSFRRGFDDYLRKLEEKRIDNLARLLEGIYPDYGSWEFLRDNQRYWFELLRQGMGRAAELNPEPPDEPPRPPPPGFGDYPPPPPPGPGPRSRPRSEFFRYGHLRMLDASRVQVVGPPPGTVLPGKEILYPVNVAGQTVGWLSFLPRAAVSDTLEKAFIRQNSRNNILILGLAILVSVLVSLLLARGFLRPIRRLADGAKYLAAGRFDVSIPVVSGDELGQLAGDFNLLARTLKRNEEARRQWVADTSHELRTPLAILRSEVEALQDGIRSATPERLRSLHAEIMGLSKLVDDLYELAVYDLGAMNYRMERLDLAEFLGEITEGFATRFEAQGIQLKRHFEARAKLMVIGDSGRLRQLFSNLFENSLRYTDAGGICEIATLCSGSKIIIEVRDSAPGVSAEALERIFQRFYREEKSRSRESGGAGLGLAIARNIAEAHGGAISARHSPLGGLGVRVELPFAGA
jgi:two-component system sensor histidine kinase BaeS